MLKGQMKEVKIAREAADAKQKAEKWLEEIKTAKFANVDIVSFLSTACAFVKKLDGYYPRDTQLVSVLVLAGSSDRKISCMAEISTGEGKTLITALLAIYLSLTSQKGISKGCVNVVTSSSVLAEENVTVVQKLFELFSVSVGNNCDKECSEDENKRRERYRNDVVYGDLSSFQRDELISRFFGRDVNLKRQADAILVDEV